MLLVRRPSYSFGGNRTDYHIHCTAEETQAHRGPVLSLITQLLDFRFFPFHCTTLWTGSLKLVLKPHRSNNAKPFTEPKGRGKVPRIKVEGMVGASSLIKA